MKLEKKKILEYNKIVNLAKQEAKKKIDQVKTLNHKFISRATEDSGEQN